MYACDLDLGDLQIKGMLYLTFEFITKTIVLDARKNRLNETVLSSTKNMCKKKKRHRAR